jgi:hypothetical protein
MPTRTLVFFWGATIAAVCFLGAKTMRARIVLAN